MSNGTPAALTSNRLFIGIVINLFATPGLGSLMARRRIAGTGQLILALAGFGLVMFWLGVFIYRMFLLAAEESAPPNTHGWTLNWGIYFFGASWLWSLVTSAQMWIDARRLLREENKNAPPKLAR